MRTYMGHFGEMTDPSTISPEKTIISTASDLAENSINQTFNRAEALLKSQEVQNFIAENNLGPYIQDLTKERIKTFLSLFGLWTVYKAIKSPIGLAAVAGAAIYVMTTNKEKVISKVSDKIATAQVSNEISKV